MFDKRNKLSSQVDIEARKHFKDKVYKTVVPRNVRLSEAPSHGMPCLIYDKNCSGSKSYISLAEEFINQRESIIWEVQHECSKKRSRKRICQPYLEILKINKPQKLNQHK